MKRAVLAILAVFVAWSVLDFLIHGVMLRSTYEATAHLWRPEAEMKMGLMSVVTIISATIFVSIYATFFARTGVKTGLLYGLLFGLVTGVGMGYGTYSVMPIPYKLALSWFLASVFEATVGGLLAGLIVARRPALTTAET